MTEREAAEGLSTDPASDDPASDFDRLEAPAHGVPQVVDTPEGLLACAEALHAGSGPVAVDAERASGFRYGQRAYLVQLRREGAGTWLVDPLPFGDLTVLDEALAGAEWVLHAATQDTPCLAALGMRPRTLFDTELGGRLAGLPRVGLSSVLEYYLGVTLAKEHSAVDWSSRPLPEPWLRYAALDVELLVDLRDRMARDLEEQGKLGWAQEEFAALRSFTVADSTDDPDAWRRTSGIHRLRAPRALAALRELWTTRDEIARDRDVSTARVLPDSTLVDLAHRMPRQATLLTPARNERSRSRQRRAEQGLLRYQRAWLTAIRTALEMPEDQLPEPARRGDAPPPPRNWADRDPEAAARLKEARSEIAALSEHLDIPVENLMSPEAVRRVLWRPPADRSESGVDEMVASLGARDWQRRLIVPILTAAMGSLPNS